MMIPSAVGDVGPARILRATHRQGSGPRGRAPLRPRVPTLRRAQRRPKHSADRSTAQTDGQRRPMGSADRWAAQTRYPDPRTAQRDAPEWGLRERHSPPRRGRDDAQLAAGAAASRFRCPERIGDPERSLVGNVVEFDHPAAPFARARQTRAVRTWTWNVVADQYGRFRAAVISPPPERPIPRQPWRRSGRLSI